MAQEEREEMSQKDQGYGGAVEKLDVVEKYLGRKVGKGVRITFYRDKKKLVRAGNIRLVERGGPGRLVVIFKGDTLDLLAGERIDISDLDAPE